jgi:mono/diheme cytochrome c family protein
MKNLILPAVIALSLFAACSDKPAPAKAAAPAPAPSAAPAAAEAPAHSEIVVPEFAVSTSADDIKKGSEVFASRGCPACHKIGGGKLVGPDLKGVTARREQKWVEKMILHPDIMVKEDDTAKKLFAEHLIPMPNQGVDPDKELPFLFAFLKSNEK